MPIIYQKTIFIAILPIFSIVSCITIMTIAHKCTKTVTSKTTYSKHKTVHLDKHKQFKEERKRRLSERDDLIKDMTRLEKRLNYQYKYMIREHDEVRHLPPLDKNAVRLLREAMSKAYYKGINVEQSVNHFKTVDQKSKTEVLDIRHVIEMLDDFDVGLTEDDLSHIRDLLDYDGDCIISKFDLLQYHHKLLDKLILAGSVIWYLEYPLLCKTAMGLLGCRSDLYDGDHTSYLRLDYDVPCYDTAWVAMVSFVVFPMLIFYTVGLPVGTLIAIKRHGEVGKTSDVVRFRYGMFTDGYKKTHMWWETIVALRKAMVIAISVFFSTYGALLQAYVGVMCVGVFLSLQMAQKPYAKSVLNNL